MARFAALFVSLLLFSAGLAFTAGCPSNSGNGDAPPSENGENGNQEEHGHSHGHEEGPEGGHLIELGDEEYHVEWLHDDEEGVLTFIIRDAHAKEEVPIDAEHLLIDMTLEDDQGEQHQTEVEIPAVGRTDANPQVARFELADKQMTYNIAENDKVTAILKVPIGGQEYTAEIEHEAHGHGHSHSH